jgi:hypothetical protein
MSNTLSDYKKIISTRKFLGLLWVIEEIKEKKMCIIS